MRNFITEDIDEFGKIGARCPTSSHRCIPNMTQQRAFADPDLEDGESFEKCWHHR